MHSSILTKARAFKATVFLSFLMAAFFGMKLTAQAAPTPGSLIKRPDASAVYYYASNGKRYVFPNERVFKTWYVDFSSVQTVTAAELAAITIGGNVTYRPGFRMIKIDTDPKVYAISRGGLLRPIASEAAAAAVFGSGWAKLIDDIPDAFFVNYTIGAPIASTADFNRAQELALATSINSDKSFGEVSATAPLPPLPTSPAATTVGVCTSDTWYCTPWDACSPNGGQTRFCTKIQDCPIADTPTPPTSQSCTPTAEPACTADMWYCQEWGACSPSGTQTRFCTMTYNCPVVETPSPSTTQSCTPPATPPACTEDVWYCTQWNTCAANGTQDRVCVISQDCPTANTPMPPQSQSCTPTCTSDTWYCTAWNTCSPDGQQDRVCVISQDCPLIQTPSPATMQACTP